MATIFVFLVDAAGAPVTGASPVFDHWNKATPGAPVATGQPMTELVGGIGGAYFADVATASGQEFFAIIDGTVAANPRFQKVAFSGETDARIETDIPAILEDTSTTLPAQNAATQVLILAVPLAVHDFDLDANYNGLTDRNQAGGKVQWMGILSINPSRTDVTAQQIQIRNAADTITISSASIEDSSGSPVIAFAGAVARRTSPFSTS